MKAFVAILAVSLLVPAVADAQVSGRGLISYRAGYNFTLQSAEASSGLADIHAASIVEWLNVCDGYTLTQNTQSSYQYLQGGEADAEFRASTWEAVDGLHYRFVATREINGQVTTEFEGEVERAAPGAPVRATIQGTSDRELDLAPATLFPTGYTRRLIDAAIANEGMIRDYLFDGSESELDHQYIAVAFLFAENTEPTESQILYSELEGVRSWPVRIAYFIDDGITATPDYEIGYNMYENGIAAELTLDYGDYVIAGAMDRLEILDESVCRP